jgi:hypothetical protein
MKFKIRGHTEVSVYWNGTTRKVFILEVCLVQAPVADCSTTGSYVCSVLLLPFIGSHGEQERDIFMKLMFRVEGSPKELPGGPPHAKAMRSPCTRGEHHMNCLSSLTRLLCLFI